MLVSTANERNVRYHIESQFPPVQIYGTTGQNWQASLIRHVPFVDACSCCLFPEEIQESAMACATAPNTSRQPDQPQVDALLPFLSFAAGLMAAAEILKTQLPGYPFSMNRVNFYSQPLPRLVAARIPQRKECFCRDRSPDVHRRMVAGGRFASLSCPGAV